MKLKAVHVQIDRMTKDLDAIPDIFWNNCYTIWMNVIRNTVANNVFNNLRRSIYLYII